MIALFIEKLLTFLGFRSKTSPDYVGVTGLVTIEVKDKNGRVKQRRRFKNLVTTKGKEYLASLLAAQLNSNLSLPSSSMKYIALGEGSTAAAVTDTSLNNELATGAYSRVPATVTSQDSTPADTTTTTFMANFTTGMAAGTLVEMGIFDASAGGNMFSHTVFSSLSITANDSITIIWEITFN